MRYPFFKLDFACERPKNASYSTRRAEASTKKMRPHSLFFGPGPEDAARRHGYHRRLMGAPTRRGPFRLVFFAALLAAACGRSAETRVAERILERYRAQSGARPLAAAQLVKLKLTGPGGAHGSVEITWQGSDYRERRESAGIVTVRGLQGGKAFYTDEDGVTRVASEPVVRELVTRFYFWRRAFLFRDHGKETAALGPADEATASVRFSLRWGNPLQLVFSRKDGSLVGVYSPRLRLEVDGPTRLTDLSDADAPVETEIAWIGLPTGPLEEVSVGGGRARFQGPYAELPFEIAGGGPVVRATIGGVPARLCLDASASGPLRVSADLALKIGLPFTPDAFGRQVAGPVEVALDGLVLPAVHLEKTRGVPAGADAAAGGTLFRETVVECDPAAGRLRLHDTAVWSPPEGYQRFIIDDDGNRPVAPLHRGAKEFRIVLGTADSSGGIVLAPEAARRLGFTHDEPAARDLGWANYTFPGVAVTIGTVPRAPDWGDDGTLAWQPLLDHRTFIDMPRRWIYLGMAAAPLKNGAFSPPPTGPPGPPQPGRGAPARPRS